MRFGAAPEPRGPRSAVDSASECKRHASPLARGPVRRVSVAAAADDDDDDRGEEWPSDGDDDRGEWTQHWDEEVGSHYYFNSSTGEATWVQPELEAIAD